MKLTRREFLELGAGASLAVTLGRGGGRRPAPDLITRKIPSSGEAVPVVGLGTRDYRADLSGDLTPFRRTLEAFARGGGTVVDTAPSYGNSEDVLGKLIGEIGIRKELFMATKVDRQGTEAGIRRMEDSLKALGTDHVDLMQVHNLRDWETQLSTLREWKKTGKIRYLGVTTSFSRQHAALVDVMRKETLDFIQVDYALDNRAAAERILPLARDRGMGVLVNLPFGRGRLFRAVGERPLPDWATGLGCTSWAQVFLKYVVSDPAVTCAIPGTTSPEHVTDNLGAARGSLPDPALRRRMEAFADEL
ncbi:MAG: aldo/keto reductase [Candidatus Palauibacterales bacterium]|nr:aldo/keto reductase [Candidatus Palauibacterales bacterium]MDP2530410.1 aldo/keto reductase [Candidatus Palauibacterales bacterium]MDP2585096.1 aldo/keto reductase [Candidatus Palauibacterales bacterium]